MIDSNKEPLHLDNVLQPPSFEAWLRQDLK